MRNRMPCTIWSTLRFDIYLVRSLNSLVDGAWNKWEEWSPCSKTCGLGDRIRKRECNNPAPLFGGKSCDGNATQTEMCMKEKCSGKEFAICVSF